MANEMQVNPMVEKLKKVLSADSIQAQFKNALSENSGAFIASIIDLYGTDKYLQQCDPKAVIFEALKAATLKLPINKQLGFAFIVPYSNKPTFTIGYKGYIQLAMRTGQYRFFNAGVIYEGMTVTRNLLTGEITLSGEPTANKAQGYFAYMELLNGFTKVLYMTTSEVESHAKRYSKSYGKETSAWATNFEEMAMKTVTRLLISKYGIMSTDMATALTTSNDGDVDSEVEDDINNGANKETIDITPPPGPDDVKEPSGDGAQNQQMSMEGPGF